MQTVFQNARETLPLVSMSVRATLTVRMDVHVRHHRTIAQYQERISSGLVSHPRTSIILLPIMLKCQNPVERVTRFQQ